MTLLGRTPTKSTNSRQQSVSSLTKAKPERVAQVLVDVGARQVDQTFDYSVTESQAKAIEVGCRVRVRFGGRLVNGFVVGLSSSTDFEGELQPIKTVLGPPVLTSEVLDLTRKVAESYLGTWSDVVRSAVPPRHVQAEEMVYASEETIESPVIQSVRSSALIEAMSRYVGGHAFVDRLTSISSDTNQTESSTRASWVLSPIEDGERVLADLVLSLPGSTLVLVPDSRTAGRVAQLLRGHSGLGVLDSSESPRARYSAFLRILRGESSIIVGTRDAAFAPVHDLKRIIVWDEPNASYRDQRSPRWNARRVAFIRSQTSRCDLVTVGYSRSIEVQNLVDGGWLKSIEVPSDKRRSGCAKVLTEADAKPNDPVGARIQGFAWRSIRKAITKGPVLVVVPRAGYVGFMVCAGCDEAVECTECEGSLYLPSPTSDFVCKLCDKAYPQWECQECGGRETRKLSAGISKTVEEIKRAFPRTDVVESSKQAGVLSSVSSEPKIVVATSGAEPSVEGGYQATSILDGRVDLVRTHLDAGELTIRHWFELLAHTRPAAQGGELSVTGSPSHRLVQALVRVDPSGWAAMELAERVEAGLPPSSKFVRVSGLEPELVELAKSVKTNSDWSDTNSTRGPMPWAEESAVYFTSTASESKRLIGVLHTQLRYWFGEHTASQLRVEVDPDEF